MGYEWARWISEVVGLAIVVGWLVIWWRRAVQRPKPTLIRRLYRALAWLVVLLPALVAFLYWLLKGEPFLAIARGGGVGAVCLIAVAFTWRLRQRVF